MSIQAIYATAALKTTGKSHDIPRRTRNRNLRIQKLDVKTSQRNAVMIASGHGVGGGGYEGWR